MDAPLQPHEEQQRRARGQRSHLRPVLVQILFARAEDSFDLLKLCAAKVALKDVAVTDASLSCQFSQRQTASCCSILN